MKVCEKCGAEIYTRDGINRCPQGCKKTKKKTGLTATQRREILDSLGLTRVRGALGGIYYE